MHQWETDAIKAVIKQEALKYINHLLVDFSVVNMNTCIYIIFYHYRAMVLYTEFRRIKHGPI